MTQKLHNFEIMTIFLSELLSIINIFPSEKLNGFALPREMMELESSVSITLDKDLVYVVFPTLYLQ